MIVTHEGSMKIYNELVNYQPRISRVPPKYGFFQPYKIEGKNKVAIVRSDDREHGIIEAFKELGGLDPITKGTEGEIIIKPNCNTDDVYPRDSHPETVRTIARELINCGINPENIIVGDMSGRARGLPTRATMENLGITSVAEEMGLGLSYFEEEPWVRVKVPEADFWPDGVTIPERVYRADRVIFTPILRSHSTADFTCALKLGVGIIDAASREWLHNGEWHHEKLVQMNLAWKVDVVLSDAMKINTGYSTDVKDEIKPGIIIASNNLAVNDAVAVSLMRYYDTVRVKDLPTKNHKQLELARKYGLGGCDLSEIIIKTSALVEDQSFIELVSWIDNDLKN
jgi:uncharacterized protein (DUF362 family)